MLYLSSFMRYNESIAYATPIENIEILIFRIEKAFQEIREMPGTIQSVTTSVTRRL